MSKKRVDLRGQQRDKNEAGIIAALCGYGCYVQQMDKSAGFDLLVGYNGRFYVANVGRWCLYVMEVKNPDGKQLTRAELEKMLTPNEALTKELIEAAGGEYHIVTDAATALTVVGIGE